MIEPISRDKSTLYGGRGGKGQKNTKIVLFIPTLLATIVAAHNIMLFKDLSIVAVHLKYLLNYQHLVDFMIMLFFEEGLYKVRDYFSNAIVV